jgi:hypothetical protein
MQFPTATTRQSDINAAIETVVRDLSPWIVHIRYDIGQDWSGEWGIFFRVLVKDGATVAVHPNLTFNLLMRLGNRLDWQELGVIPYFNFRSQSEQEKMLEATWA